MPINLSPDDSSPAPGWPIRPTSHPRWCAHRDQCASYGAHRGRLVEIRTASGDQSPVSIQLAQANRAGDPYITLRGESGFIVLTIRQARAVRHVLRGLINWAERSTPRRPTTAS